MLTLAMLGAWAALPTQSAAETSEERRRDNSAKWACEIGGGYLWLGAAPTVGTPQAMTDAKETFRRLALSVAPWDSSLSSPGRDGAVSMGFLLRPPGSPFWFGPVVDRAFPTDEYWLKYDMLAHSTTLTSTTSTRGIAAGSIRGNQSRFLIRAGYDPAAIAGRLTVRPEAALGIARGDSSFSGILDTQVLGGGGWLETSHQEFKEQETWSGFTYDVGLLIGYKLFVGDTTYIHPWARLNYSEFPGKPSGTLPEIRFDWHVTLTFGAGIVF